MKAAERIARERARVMPLSMFSPDRLERIREQVKAPYPPARWIYFGDETVGRGPIAAIESRAWYEWHWERGIEPRSERDPLPQTMRLAVIEWDGFICQICGGEVARDDIHIDHIKPYSKGGQHTLDNLQVTHSKCNLRKGATYPDPQLPVSIPTSNQAEVGADGTD